MATSDDGHLESQRKLIVIAMWVIMFLQVFVVKSYGVLLPVLLEQFATYTRNIGAIVSLLYFSGNIVGLSAQALTMVIERRILIMACGTIGSLGLFVSSIAGSIPILTIGMFFAGMVSMANNINCGLITSYFQTYSTPVTYVVTSSLPIAIMVSAPLTQLFIDTYGWRGCILIISALSLNIIAAAVLLSPSKQIQTNDKDVAKQSLQNDKGDVAVSLCETIYTVVKSTVNVSLLRNGYFLNILVISFVSGYVMNGWVVFLVSIAQSKGLQQTDSAIVATISGVGDVLVRLILAAVQVKDTDYKHLFVISSVLFIISFGGMIFATSFWLLSLLSLVLGFGFGMSGPNTLNAANAIIEKDDAVGAVSWINIIASIGYITSGYISGWLYDISGTFNLTLIAQCIVSSVMMLTIVAERLWLLFKTFTNTYKRIPLK